MSEPEPWTRAFWKETRDTAIKAAASTALGAIGADALVSTVHPALPPVDINWQFVVLTTLLGAIVSVLTSISSVTIQRRNGNGKSEP